MELDKMTEEEFSQLLNDVLSELERRNSIKNIPTQIAELRTKFLDIGGDPAELSS